ncbi:MAG TPA: hypothetical protein VLE70_18615 [Anaerolineae bacterium]|nr:hypothetical protein [Anaerolineae bacterium]
MSITDFRNQWLTMGLVACCGLLLVGCSLMTSLRDKATSVVNPFVGAPVTAAIDGKTLIIANNTDETVYHLVLPTDILPVIEWAPCLAPEACPAEQRIEPGDEKRIAVNSVVREETESITVFWWGYLKKLPGASIPPMEMDEIVVPLPK